MKFGQSRIRHLEMKMGHILKSTLTLALASTLAVGLASVAEAGKRNKAERYEDEDYGYVTSRATIGGKEITAPVRPGPYGRPQVDIGHNTWVDCEITCEYTLRRHTVDFWDFDGGRTASPGYFSYDVDLDTGAVYRRGPRFLGRY
jgi:hypothetical protein